MNFNEQYISRNNDPQSSASLGSMVPLRLIITGRGGGQWNSTMTTIGNHDQSSIKRLYKTHRISLHNAPLGPQLTQHHYSVQRHGSCACTNPAALETEQRSNGSTNEKRKEINQRHWNEPIEKISRWQLCSDSSLSPRFRAWISEALVNRNGRGIGNSKVLANKLPLRTPALVAWKQRLQVFQPPAGWNCLKSFS